jgi:hypothetical protein
MRLQAESASGDAGINADLFPLHHRTMDLTTAESRKISQISTKLESWLISVSFAGVVILARPVRFTLEQRAQQSLAQYNAPIKVENQIGVSLSFDDFRTRSGSLDQGRVNAALDQGVNGDANSDVSAGLAWNVGNRSGFWLNGRSVPNIPPSISVCFVGNQPFENSGPVRVDVRDR